MKQIRLLLLLVLLMTAATGAWGMQVYISYPSWPTGTNVNGDGNLVLEMEASDSFENMKAKIEDKSGLNPTYMKLYFNSVEMANNETLYAKGVTANSVLTLVYTPPFYVTMKDGVKDDYEWTVKVGEGEAQALPIGGLSEGQTVTLQYNGRLKVKGVKATSDAAAPSVPDGALSGVFSVSSTKQVYFSKGNLRYASSKWSFFDNQYDYYTGYSADAWDHFGWSTSATTYGMNTSTDNGDYSGDFVDWGATMGTGWFTLSKDEWTYLFKTRSASTVGGTENGRYAKAKVNNVPGIILFPDTYTHPDGVTAPVGVNATGDTGWNGNSYTVADWTKMESAGCVFLPAAGYREGSSVTSPGSYGYYWSATPSGTNNAYRVYSNSRNLNPENTANRRLGLSVRLVCEGATSDAAPAATTYSLLSAATAEDIGKVVCAAGHLHDAKTAVPDGCTAVGILGKVTETGHGLILALKDATSQEWNTINGWTSASYAGTTLKVLPDDGARSTNLASYTTLGETAVSNWAVAQKSDYDAIFTNLGSTTGNNNGYTYDDNVKAYITTGVGGTAIDGRYWSATDNGGNYAWYFRSDKWSSENKGESHNVRPVLGF